MENVFHSHVEMVIGAVKDPDVGTPQAALAQDTTLLVWGALASARENGFGIRSTLAPSPALTRTST